MSRDGLTPQQETLRAETKRFAETTLSQADASEDLRVAWQLLAQQDVLRALTAAEFGGTGLDVPSATALLEGLGQGCRDNGLTMAVCAQLCAIQEPIRQFGSDDQKMRYLPGMAEGRLIGAYALTEAETGSEALSLKTTATRDGDSYVLNGTKTLIGMAPYADVIVVFAATAPERKAWGLSVFLVEAGDPGVLRLEAQETVGLEGVTLGGLRFDECRIPADRLLAVEGAGQAIFQHSMIWERSLILASHVGAMARQLELATEFARGRVLGGRPIISHQSVSNRLADMAVRLETSRLMQYRAAALLEAGAGSASFAAMTNLHISEAFLASSMDAVRIHGGAAMMSAHHAGQDLRDSIGGVIYSGTSDIQRQIIASTL